MKFIFLMIAVCSFNVSMNAQQTADFKDVRDGKKYKTVKIGKQTWMAENLNYSTASGSWCYEDSKSNCEIYGRLYNWETAKNVCPIGWHLPNDDEWTQLINFLGGENIAGGKMKETGTIHWEAVNTETDNSSKFTGLPGGYRDSLGTYFDLKSYGNWWTSTESDAMNNWERVLNSRYPDVYRDNYGVKGFGFSIRCVSDL